MEVKTIRKTAVSRSVRIENPSAEVLELAKKLQIRKQNIKQEILKKEYKNYHKI